MTGLVCPIKRLRLWKGALARPARDFTTVIGIPTLRKRETSTAQPPALPVPAPMPRPVTMTFVINHLSGLNHMMDQENPSGNKKKVACACGANLPPPHPDLRHLRTHFPPISTSTIMIGTTAKISSIMQVGHLLTRHHHAASPIKRPRSWKASLHVRAHRVCLRIHLDILRC